MQLQVECTINGIGERAGNTSLEELAMALKTRKNYYDAYTGLSHSFLCETSDLVSQLTHMEVSKNKPIVGANVFSHESGIHQHGVLSDASTYEIMSPNEVGWKGKTIVIGKHSGAHAVASVLMSNDCPYDESMLNEITADVKKYAAKVKRSLSEDEVLSIARNNSNNGKEVAKV